MGSLKPWALTVLLVAGLAGGLAAQAGGVHHGVLVGFSPSVLSPNGTNHLVQIDAYNRGVAYTTSPPGTWPFWGSPHGMVMDVDNRNVILPVLVDSRGLFSALVHWNPALPGVGDTLWFGPTAGLFAGATEWTLNADGNPVTLDRLSNPPRLAEYDRLSKIWRFKPLSGSLASFAGMSGLHWDALNGGYLFAGWSGGGMGNPPALGPTVLYRASHDGTSVTVLARDTSSAALAGFGGHMLDNGDWVSSSAAAGALYYTVKRASGKWSAGPAYQGRAFLDVTAEVHAAQGRGFFGVYSQGSGGVAYVDPTTAPATIISMYSGGASTWPGAPSQPLEVLPLHQRTLCTRRTLGGCWDLNIRPCSVQLADKPFVVAAGVTGSGPPTLLPDGREIFLHLDLISYVSMVGGLAPFFRGNLGRLDRNGEATAVLDLTALGTAANGIVVHFCGVVLDPNAPSGVALVLEPHAMVIEVRP